MIANKKSSILLVLKVLEEYTDEKHYLTQPQIVTKIEELYGIELERKSIGSSLKLLEELDYDIAKGPKGGFALLTRTFDNTEAFYLIDAIFSSRSVDGKCAQKIALDVSKCFSKYERKDFSYLYKSSEINRTFNQDVLYNINVIRDAMKEGKRIGFQYLSYDEKGKAIPRQNGFQYIVSPYYLMNSFGRYYLLGNYREKYRPLQAFRVDYMMHIELKEDWPIKEMKKLKGLPKDFSISKYMNDHLYIFDGETIDVTLELDSPSAILYVKDWFGEMAKIWKEDDKIFVSIHSSEEALYYWVLQYSDSLKVISPQSFVRKVVKGLEKSLMKYQ